MDPSNEENDTQLERATAARLSRLGAIPVDTSRVAARLRAELPRPPGRTASWLRPLRAVAASLVVFAVVGAILLSTMNRAVLASPEQLAQVHEEMVAGRSTQRVDSVEAARRAIAVEWPQAPALPDVPAEHVMACCMMPLNDRKTACVLLNSGDVPVTMMVVNAKDMEPPPDAPAVVSRGVTYRVSASGATNMVMTERDGRWVCFMGSLPTERLIALASTTMIER